MIRCFIILFLISVNFSFPVLLYAPDSLSISSNPSPFTINSAVAGQQPAAIVNSSTYYTYSTAPKARDIVGQLSSNMPTGVTLTLALAAPSGATSAGAVTMSTTNQTLVSGIPRQSSGTNLTMTYTFSATVQAAQVTNATKTLTFTLQ